LVGEERSGEERRGEVVVGGGWWSGGGVAYRLQRKHAGSCSLQQSVAVAPRRTRKNLKAFGRR
jgi:hypothetical protein